MLSFVSGTTDVRDSCIAAETATTIRSANMVAYIRQDLSTLPVERQISCMAKYGAVEWFTDACSGASILKDRLRVALNSLESGSVFFVARLETLSWRLEEVLWVMEQVSQRGAHFVSVSEGIDSRQPMPLHHFADAVRQHQADVSAARNYDPYSDVLDRVTSGEIAACKAAEILGVSKATVSRRLNGLVGDYEPHNV